MSHGICLCIVEKVTEVWYIILSVFVAVLLHVKQNCETKCVVSDAICFRWNTRWNKVDLFKMWLYTRSIRCGACRCEWLQGGARLPTTHTLVTLCNCCYLIIENSSGRNQVSLCWRGKTGSAAAACLLQSYWLRSCCRSMICFFFHARLVVSSVKQLGAGRSLWLQFIWAREKKQ